MKFTPFTFLKKITLAYFAFGAGIIVGSIIASAVAGLMLWSTLSLEQLEILNEVAEDFKKD